jgi:hypothetical protein
MLRSDPLAAFELSFYKTAVTGRRLRNRMEMARSEAPVESIQFDDWKGALLTAKDLDDLVRIVRAYLATWKAEELQHLPTDVAARALMSSEDIFARAVMASRAELKFAGHEHEYQLLREMSLTLSAAANRLRHLQALHRQPHLRDLQEELKHV